VTIHYHMVADSMENKGGDGKSDGKK